MAVREAEVQLWGWLAENTKVFFSIRPAGAALTTRQKSFPSLREDN